MRNSLEDLVKPLSRRQKKYVYAVVLLGAGDPKAIGVPLRTLLRWKQVTPGFTAILAQAKEQFSTSEALASYLEDDVFPIIEQIRELALQPWDVSPNLVMVKKWAMGLILQLITSAKAPAPANKGDTYNTLLQFINKAGTPQQISTREPVQVIEAEVRELPGGINSAVNT